MTAEDDESQARRAEDDRLNDERLRLLAEARRREAERRRRVILEMESSLTVDIETIVVQEELRDMLRVQVEELERQRALDAELARRLLTSNLAREMAERLVNGWLADGVRNSSETDEMRARRLAEEEGKMTSAWSPLKTHVEHRDNNNTLQSTLIIPPPLRNSPQYTPLNNSLSLNTPHPTPLTINSPSHSTPPHRSTTSTRT